VLKESNSFHWLSSVSELESASPFCAFGNPGNGELLNALGSRFTLIQPPTVGLPVVLVQAAAGAVTSAWPISPEIEGPGKACWPVTLQATRIGLTQNGSGVLQLVAYASHTFSVAALTVSLASVPLSPPNCRNDRAQW
jgi:hypothetical protein